MGILDRLRKKANSSVASPMATPADGAPADGAPAAAPENGPQRAEAGASEADRPSGLFARLRQGLKKTTDVLNTDLRDLFKQEGELLSDDFLDRLYALLIHTDMGAGPAGDIRDEVQNEFRGRVVQMDDVFATVKRKLQQLMLQSALPDSLATEGPTVIMVVGVNGAGKTTSIAKLAARYVSQGKHVVLGAGDTFRAAAVEQLTIWAGRIGAEIVKGEMGSDPASVAHRAVARALEVDADICIVDTAGRLQTQANLMEQLSKIRRVMAKQIPAAPHEVLLVMDATAGQNGISQAQGFSEAVQCTGIVLAKLDGSAKGGVVIPIRQRFDLPVKYIGVGEKETDLADFDAQTFVEALFDAVASEPRPHDTR